MAKQKEQLMTQSAAAELKGMTLAAVNELVRRKVIRSEEVYGKGLVYRSDVEAYMPREKRSAAAKKAASKKGSKK